MLRRRAKYSLRRTGQKTANAFTKTIAKALGKKNLSAVGVYFA
jgi:hypothetical protein